LGSHQKRRGYDPGKFPVLKSSKFPDFPKELKFIYAENLLEKYPDLPLKQRETQILQNCPAVFITGMGWPLKDGYPHEMRATDYDDWITETSVKNGDQYHVLNGDILVWDSITKRRHELFPMGIRATKGTFPDR